MKSSSEFIEDLKRRGYSLRFGASIKGKSGAVHRVDVLAERPEARKVVLLEGRGREASLEIINTFVAALDGGAEACYVLDGEPDEEDRKLAEHYRITLLTRTR